MIKLTRLNGKSLAVNAMLIKYVESIPDTLITLTDGSKLIVKESVDEIINKMKNFLGR